MDLTKLESMSSEALQAIRDKCVEVLASRKENSLRRGGVAWFFDKDGRKRTMMIERVNAKSVSGREIDPVTLKNIGGTVWRVSPALLNVIGEPAPAKPAAAHKPSTTASGAW